MQKNDSSAKRTILTALLLAALTPLLLLQACQPHKEIECTEGMMRRITVRFDWDNAPEAKPQGMSVYFFPLNGDRRIWSFDIAGTRGGEIELPVGTYRMLAFNNDTHNIDFTHTSDFNSFEAVTHSIASSAQPAAKDLHSMPEALYVGVVENLQVTICGVSYTDSKKGKNIECGKSIVTCHPASRVCHYTVIIKDIKNRERIKNISGELSGLGTGILLAGGEIEPPPVSIPFPMAVEGSSTAGTLLGFGTVPRTENTLTLNISLNDGTSMVASCNVTRQVLNSPDPMNVMIIINNLEIPDGGTPQPPIGDGDIEVGIDGWTVVIINISTDHVF